MPVETLEYDFYVTRLNDIRAPAYTDNSCYLDSLMTLIMTCGKGRFRRAFTETKTTSPIRQEILRLATKFVEKDDEQVTSSQLRDELVKIIPSIYEDGVWQMYHVDHVYNELAEIFKLQVSYNDETYVLNSRHRIHHIRNTPRSTTSFSFEEFMEKPTISLDNTPYTFNLIDWNTIDGSMLVFYNSNTNLKKYNSMESEQYTIGDETVTFNKKQIFDEIILDGKYMLVGVIMLEGVVPGQMDSGKHYFSIIRNSEGAYFKYDDMSPKILQFNDTAIPIVKNIIFGYQRTNRRSTIPVMYFYERIPTFYSPPTPSPVDVFIDYDDKDLTIIYKDKKYPFDTKESLRRKLTQLYEHL